MPKDRDDELNTYGDPMPEFTLEEILAEYRDRRESGLDDDTIPLPVIPQQDLPPEHRAGRRKGTGNNVVRFPGRRLRPGPLPYLYSAATAASCPFISSAAHSGFLICPESSWAMEAAKARSSAL